MNKNIAPLYLLITAFILYVLGTIIFVDTVIGSWFKITANIFFLLGVVGGIANTIKRRRGYKNNQLDKKDKALKPINAKNIQLIIISFLALVLVVVGFLFFKNLSKSNESEPEVKEREVVNEQVIIDNDIMIEVGTFYDGQNGYSISIPSGNESVCIWTYSAGSAQIPYLKTTEARIANEKHTLSYYGDEEDFKVFCVDDFGNQYKGKFPN